MPAGLAPPPGLLVDPLDVARRLGVTEPSPAQYDQITDAILDAQGAVEGELNRPLIPEDVTLGAQRVQLGATDLTSWRSWAPGFDDDYRVVSYQAAPGGTWTVTYSVGMDARACRPVTTYVIAHALVLVRESPEGGIGKRVVTSMSAEGQSISYAASSATSGTGSGPGGVAGAMPDLKSLRAFKRHAVGKANGAGAAPWPYSGLAAFPTIGRWR